MPMTPLRRLLPLLFLAACAGTADPQPLSFPIHRAAVRPTPLHFGMYVTPDPATNPITPPERFTGYHVATDYEVTAEERNADVPVYAVCSGEVARSSHVEGYGGLLVQRCTISGQEVTVLYGHVLLASLPENGTMLTAGDRLGILAPANSYENGWNRKHLHLAIHRGTQIDVRGYVQREADVQNYLDPQEVLLPAPLPPMSVDMQPYWQALPPA